MQLVKNDQQFDIRKNALHRFRLPKWLQLEGRQPKLLRVIVELLATKGARQQRLLRIKEFRPFQHYFQKVIVKQRGSEAMYNCEFIEPWLYVQRAKVRLNRKELENKPMDNVKHLPEKCYRAEHRRSDTVRGVGKVKPCYVQQPGAVETGEQKLRKNRKEVYY